MLLLMSSGRDRELQLEVDEIGSIVDGSVVRAHQDAAGGKGGSNKNALGRSRGGFSTKVHAIVDTKARPIHIAFTPGQRHEMVKAMDLLDYARGNALIGDTGYDSGDFIAEARHRELKPVIHSRPERRRSVASTEPSIEFAGYG